MTLEQQRKAQLTGTSSRLRRADSASPTSSRDEPRPSVAGKEPATARTGRVFVFLFLSSCSRRRHSHRVRAQLVALASSAPRDNAVVPMGNGKRTCEEKEDNAAPPRKRQVFLCSFVRRLVVPGGLKRGWHRPPWSSGPAPFLSPGPSTSTRCRITSDLLLAWAHAHKKHTQNPLQ